MLRADTIARFLRDRIGSENVIFVSGTDCYGSTATEGYRKAKANGQIPANMSLQDFIYSNHIHQKQTFEMFEIKHNLFGASAFEPMKSVHEEMSALFINTLHKHGMLSKRSSYQFFDKKLGVLLNGRQVIGRCPIEGCQSEKGYADECDLGHQYLPMDLIDPVSALSGEKPELRKVENWYFDLDRCLDEIMDLQIVKDIGKHIKECETKLKFDYSQMNFAPDKQLRSYEFQHPTWFINHLKVSKNLHLVNNATYGFRVLAGCRAFLLPHQISTVARCFETTPVRYMLADEVGLGKTIEACSILSILASENQNLRVLIIVPSALVSQWQNELHYKYGLDAAVASPHSRICLLPMEDISKSLLVFSMHWDLAIVDETHRLLANDAWYSPSAKSKQASYTHSAFVCNSYPR